MENFPQFTEPVALARPPGAHRLEAFSPKLGRRLTFYRRALLDLWLLFEADPSVIALRCPVQSGHVWFKRLLADRYS